MVGPLWARALYTEKYPALFDDLQARSLKEEMRSLFPSSEDEFRKMEEFVDELVGLALAIRARTFDDAILKFLTLHPDATIINIGCGLDTTFSRVDNENIQWFNIDLPEAIEFRLKLIPDAERSRCIPKSVFDYGWMDEVSFNQSKGVFIIAGGLFTYFTEDKVRDLFIRMANRFAEGEILFDCGSKRGNRFINRRFRKLGVTGVDHILEINTSKDIEKWSTHLKVLERFPYFSKVKLDSKWSKRTRMMIRLNSVLNFESFFHVAFI